MKKILMILLVVAVAAACDKNQKAVKKLDGTWKATKWSSTYDGETFDLIAFGGSVEWTFTKCKLKDNEYCTSVIKFSFFGDSDTETINFTVTNDGTKLVFDGESVDIVELKGKTCKLKMTDTYADDTTEVTEITLEKQ